jgi:predicted SnoaL-like aldol condensation-catalyzing enzyme
MALSARGDGSVSRPWAVYRTCAAACAAALGLGCADDPAPEPETATAPLSPEQEANVVIATRVIEEGLGQANADVVNELVSPSYIQHNATAQDGREGLLALVASLADQGGTPVTIHRKLAEGDLVALHSTYGEGSGRLVAFDVFRVENGLLAEHWDALQLWVEPQATLSGNTLVDGETTVVDRDRTQQNKQLVTSMVRDVFVEGRFDRLATYLADEYIQHNPRSDNGLAGAQRYFTAVQNQGVAFAYTASPLVVADGNFVLVGSEGFLGTTTSYTVFYDLFRVDGARIVEHWDVIQPVDQDRVPHDNGLF